MSKQEIIDHIRRLNPTASAEFLADFDQEDLLAYLHQLRELEREGRPRTRAEPAPAA